MGLKLNFINQSLFFLALLFIIILAIVITLLVVISNSKMKNSESHECLICKDDILAEFKHIRHEYNNMLQGLLCIIEDEDWEELVRHKDIILKRTQELNRNNLTQLVRIKNKNILIIIYNLLMRAEANEVTINLNIYNDIEDLKAYGGGVIKVFQDYVQFAYEVALATSGAKEVNLKINANKEGLSFVMENKAQSSPNRSIPNPRTPKRSKNLFFNSFIKNDYLIQEILFSI
jgi:hypothetical protein